MMPTASVTWDVLGPAQDPMWQKTLDRLFPPGQSVQSLHIYWEPGYAWHPVERWMVGVVWPDGMIPPQIDRSWLEGENPAKLGYWDYKTDEWISQAPPISRMQWKFWQNHKRFIEPYWVVQGDGRGHKYRLSRQESVIAKVNGAEGDTPPPGDLPYAVPDQRMFALLAQMDRVRLNLMGLQWVERGGQKMTEARAKAVEHMRSELWSWLSSQAGEWAEHAASQATKELWDPAPVEPFDGYADQQAEAAEERFLTGA